MIEIARCFLYLDSSDAELEDFGEIAWADRQMMGSLPGTRQEQVLAEGVMIL